jgi:hypothetical protein
MARDSVSVVRVVGQGDQSLLYHVDSTRYSREPRQSSSPEEHDNGSHMIVVG